MDETTPRTDCPILTSAERYAILAEDDSSPHGNPRHSALLRQHGLYTSQLAKWRQHQARRATSLDNYRSGSSLQPANPLTTAVIQLRRENTRLQRQIAQTTAIIDAQKPALPTTFLQMRNASACRLRRFLFH